MPTLPIRLAVLVVAATMIVALPARAAGPESTGLFGSHEFKSTRMAAFTKWTGMLARFDHDRQAADPDCRPSRYKRCYYKSWRRFIAGLGKRDTRSLIEAVHRHMNLSPYITDPRNWGLRDYWETPGEFFRKDGDCEDYAIVKYLTLRALGIDPGTMRVVVVQDLNLNVPHAVLAVKLDGRTLILDNQIREVVDARSIHHYRPIYSINETAWWLHRL